MGKKIYWALFFVCWIVSAYYIGRIDGMRWALTNAEPLLQSTDAQEGEEL